MTHVLLLVSCWASMKYLRRSEKTYKWSDAITTGAVRGEEYLGVVARASQQTWYGYENAFEFHEGNVSFCLILFVSVTKGPVINSPLTSQSERRDEIPRPQDKGPCPPLPTSHLPFKPSKQHDT